jgi:hypothetical protein
LVWDTEEEKIRVLPLILISATFASLFLEEAFERGVLVSFGALFYPLLIQVSKSFR